MFVACRNCDWGQDDFWNKDYSPLTCTMDTCTRLLRQGTGEGGPLVPVYDEMAHNQELPLVQNNGNTCVDFRKLIAYNLRKLADRIEEMHWPTYETFQAQQRPVCPKCGSDNLTLD